MAERPENINDEIWLSVAELMATKSTCERLQVGCVITDRNHLRVLGIGYNGNYAGGPNTCDDPTRVGGCGDLHAEVNALLKCDNTIRDKIIYVTHAPCLMCAKAIINAGASRVVYSETYRITDGINLLNSVGIDTEWYHPIEEEENDSE